LETGRTLRCALPPVLRRQPDQVNLKVEFEIEDNGTELEIELTW